MSKYSPYKSDKRLPYEELVDILDLPPRKSKRPRFAIELSKPKMSAVINSENVIQQIFPFRESLINYILKTPNVKIYRKLYSTCKYFYQQRPFHIIDGLCFRICLPRVKTERIKFNEQEIYLVENEENFQKLLTNSNHLYSEKIIKLSKFMDYNNLWISGRIYYHNSNSKRLSWWITKISRCTITQLDLQYKLTEKELEILSKEGTIKKISVKENITINEFNVLAKSGSIKKWNIQKVIYPNENFMVVEDIVAAVPNAVNVRLEYSHITPLTLQILCSMNRKNKFIQFYLYQIDQILDENEYFEFLKTHAASGSSFGVCFVSNIFGIEEENKFIRNLKTKVILWKTPIVRPFIYQLRIYFPS